MANIGRRSRRDHDHAPEDPHVIEFESSFKPRKLRKCFNGVLRGTNTTETCMESRMSFVPLTTISLQSYRSNMFVEARQFHDCLCGLHTLSEQCTMNLLLIQPNKTLVKDCFDGVDNDNTPFTHAASDSNYSCDLRAGHRVKCQKNSFQVEQKTTRFQHVINCLSESLRTLPCPVSETTTSSPVLTTHAPALSDGKIIIFVLALVISLLLGVLATWLGVFCWKRQRRRKKGRSLPPLMPRPEHASLPNLYDDEYTEDHIYDVVKPEDSPTSQPVPDLLSRVPSLPPLNNRTPKSKVQVEPKISEASFRKVYEPLLRDGPVVQDSINIGTSNKDPSDMNDYLPLLPDGDGCEREPENTQANGSCGWDKQDKQEGDLHTAGVNGCSGCKGKVTGNEYFVLEPQVQVINPVGPLSEFPGRNDGKSTSDSGYVVSLSSKEDCEDGERDSDGYEVPLSPAAVEEDVVNV